MYLFFDTSAAGVPKSYKAEVEDTFAWPRMIQLAWELVEPSSKIIEAKNFIIKPEGFEIPEASAEFHQIDPEEAAENGHQVVEVLEQFAQVIDQAEYVISFNFNYNSKVFGAESIRQQVKHNLFRKESFCLMQETTFYTKIMGKYGKYKWPTLSQLFQKIYGSKYEGANRAEMDTRATSMCFFYLLQNNVLELD